jgi:hypothetical protein
MIATVVASDIPMPPALDFLLRFIDWQISEDLFMIDWQFIWHD